MENAVPGTLPMMAIRETVIFPGMMTPFVVGRAASIRALEAALGGDQRIFFVAQRDATVDDPTADDVFGVGTIVNIVQNLKLPDGNMKVLVEGAERATVVAISDEDGFFRATVRTWNGPVEAGPELDGLVKRVQRLFERHVTVATDVGFGPVLRAGHPNNLADTVAAGLPLTLEEKQELLETFDPIARLTHVAEILGREADVTISTAVLTRWAESCLMINRLGELVRAEIDGPNRAQRTRDLASRAQRLARHLADELAAYGAYIPPRKR